MKELTIILFCTWKFAATFPLAIMGMKMPFWDTILYTNIGGILGVIIFVFLSKGIIILWDKYIVDKNLKSNKKQKKVFTRRSRRMVNIRSKYGLPGIVFLNPVVLSIPVGSFLVTKYYGASFRNLSFLVAGQVCWSFVYALLYFKLYSLFV